MFYSVAEDVWIGLQLQMGRWIWADGSNLTTDIWGSNQPKNNENCAESDPDVKFIKWESETCTDTNQVACFNLGGPLPANYTMSANGTASGTSQSRTTEPLTANLVPAAILSPPSHSSNPNMDLPIRSTPAPLTTRPDNVTSETHPSYQQTSCSLAPDFSFLENCPALKPSTTNNPHLATEVYTTLLDDNFATCMTPFQVDSLLRLALNAWDTMGSSVLRFQIVGKDLECVQPTTLVYLDLAVTSGTAPFKPNINYQECPLVRSSLHINLTTCTYECRPLVPCKHPALFGVEVQHFPWLPRNQHLVQLCDIRAFVWKWIWKYLGQVSVIQ